MTRSCANHMIITRLTWATGCHARLFRFTEHGLHTKGVQKITATIHETRKSNKPTDQLSQVDRPLSLCRMASVTFPAAEHHRPLASTKLYCLVTEAHLCEQLVQIAARQWSGRKSNLRPLNHTSSALTTTTPPSHPSHSQ